MHHHGHQPTARAAARDDEALETAIESAALMMQFIWRLHRLGGTIENFSWGGADSQIRQQQSRELASLLRADQEMALDAYMKLLAEVAAHTDPLAITAQIGNAQKEFETTGHEYMRFFLKLIAQHIDEARHGDTPSRDQVLSDVFARTAKASQ